MNPSFLYCTLILIIIINTCSADHDNILDSCPTSKTAKQTVFFNGLPCKPPSSVTASDFKSRALGVPGDTDNFHGSATNIVTASDYPGLNTLGLSVARTDLDLDGMVMPHSHPRASEMFFVSKGTVVAGFVDTKNRLFQKVVKEGDVFVFPEGLLHFCLNVGYEPAVGLSVLSSQNPGIVGIADAMFGPASDEAQDLAARLIRLAGLEIDGLKNVTMAATPVSETMK